MRRALTAGHFACIALLGGAACAPMSADATDREVRITSRVRGETITVTVSPKHYAGAVSSLRFRGVEYVEISDHGRQMQSAIQLDSLGECFNPTEAGSKSDARKPTTSSRVLDVKASGGELVTRTQAAFWLAPGEDYGAYCSGPVQGRRNGHRRATNKTVLSEFVVEKKLRFDPKIPNLLVADTTWTMPATYSSANIEALTTYLPRTFGTFFVYSRSTRTLRSVPAGDVDSDRQHTTDAVIIATLNGGAAMGAFAPAMMEDPALGYMSFFDFPKADAPTTKWACVFYVERLKAGTPYTRRCNAAVGSVDEVIAAIDAYPIKGQAPLPTRPIYRFYKEPMHKMALSYTEGAALGFHFEMTSFQAFVDKAAGRRAIYLCPRIEGAFIATADRCADPGRRLAGYIAVRPGNGLKPLYSFRAKGGRDILTTTDLAEGVRSGYAQDPILGYVPG